MIAAELSEPIKDSENSISITTRIIGGDDVERDYPWMVALYNSGNFYCGGVLISSHWIATAAHCVYSSDDSDGNATAYDASQYSVVIGDSTYYSTITLANEAEANVYTIKNVVINTDYYSYTYDNDIALLELDEPYYQPGPAIATASEFNSLVEDDPLTVIGYGLIDARTSTSPTNLQEVDLPFVPASECYWNNFGDLTDNMFCAGDESRRDHVDSCAGDSGGPVFKTINGELTLVGLVSWGRYSCADVPGVYTKISAVRSWILAQIDGFQVVEEGTASYNNDTESFSSGLISVHYYGSNEEIDDELIIGDLTFDDANYANTLSITNSCYSNILDESNDNCAIDVDLQGAIDEDVLFKAALSVTPNAVIGEQSYDLRLVTEVIDSENDSDQVAIGDSGDASSSAGSNDSRDSSGGAFGFAWLLILVSLLWLRISLDWRSIKIT